MGHGSSAIGGKNPAVSVILPVFNGARTIVLAVDSILAQSFPDFELIVINDGSSDNTVELLRRFDDPRLKLISDDQNKGLAARLNEGTTLAKGKYIARMDADDLAFPERLQKQVTFLNDHPDIDLLATRAIVFSEARGAIGLLPFFLTHEEITRAPWRGIPMPHPTWMGRRVWFEKNPYRTPEVKRAEDQELLLRALGKSRYACLPDILLAYRQDSFELLKTLTARRHLMMAQMNIFCQQGRYMEALLSLVMTGGKVFIDLLSALPACERIFFWRRTDDNVPKETLIVLDKLLKPTAP
jgi:glycosyltransferase involved in cell wall biosynthesis